MTALLKPRSANKQYLATCGALLLTLTACNQSSAPSQVSEQPAALTQQAVTKTQAREGLLGLRARFAYSDIQTLIESEMPVTYPVVDSKRVCKRIIGIKTCATANWDLTVKRQGEVEVQGKNDRILMQTPIAFDGVVGIEGKAAKLLGLSNLQVQGSVMTDIMLGLNIDDSWCPQMEVSVSYNWLEKPTIAWNNKIDFSLETVVNDALDKQLAQLQPKLNESIDCEQFKQQIQKQWRNHSFAISLPDSVDTTDTTKMFLNFSPTGFAFSGLHTEDEKLGLGFTIAGTTVVESEQSEALSLTLPPLQQLPYQNNRTDFDILLRSSYSQLEAILRPRIVGKSYSVDSIAGTATVIVNTINLASNNQGVTISIGFVAQLPGKNGDTTGQLFLIANPSVDSENEAISLQDIRLSKIIDSALWNLLSSVFENQIITALEQNASINYADQMRQLENKIALQLQDRERTAGLDVEPSNISVQLLDIIPEQSALALRARVSADIDIDIPLSFIKNAKR